MSLWSDSDFLQAVDAGAFGVDPWRPEDLTPNGLDLRISHVLVPSGSGEPVESGVARVPPLSRFVVGTEEYLKMPTTATAQLWLRSSYARRGVLASFGKVDAGFHGNLSVGAFNASGEALDVEVGDRFCQLVMEDLKSAPTAAYGEKSGNYQGQRGITLERS